MANTLYPSAGAYFMDGSINMSSDAIRVALIRGYTPSTAHAYLSDVTGAGGTIVGSNGQASKTVTAGGASAGTYDAADDTFGAIAAGAACGHLLIYKDTGVASTSRVVCWIDTATGLPLTPNGSTVNALWDNGTNKIYRLGA